MEAINKAIKHNLKTKLENLKGKWVDELPKVLSLKLQSKTPTGETLFSFSYGYEANVLVEIGMSSLRWENFDQDQNHLLQRRKLDILDEKRRDSLLRVAAYQRRTVRYFNSKVKPRRFQVGDLVLRKVLQNKGALDPNWEDPFKIVEILAPRAYKLSYLSEYHIPTSWMQTTLRFIINNFVFI